MQQAQIFHTEENRVAGTRFYTVKALIQGQLIGYCDFAISQKNPREVLLSYLFVNPEWRGQGLGRQLVTYLKENFAPEICLVANFADDHRPFCEKHTIRIRR